MALSATVLATQTNKLKEIYVSITPSNSPAGYVTGGDTLDLTALLDVLGSTLTFARLRFIAIQVQWTVDNVLASGPAAQAGIDRSMPADSGMRSLHPPLTQDVSAPPASATRTCGPRA